MGLGGLAGFYGGWLDDLIMRTAEIFLALPWLYLLFAVRAFLPLQIPPNRIFLLLIIVVGMAGWARPARLIRGVVLSAKERDYVLAAKGFGATDLYLLRRHVLPQASSVVLAQAAVFIPKYVLAEVVLSLFGLGVSEPTPSWGNLLANLRQYSVLESYWWMFLPLFALMLVFLAYHSLFSYYGYYQFTRGNIPARLSGKQS
jgi:peptide/nickel transport system permease protein